MIDTNVFVSGALLPGSVSDQAAIEAVNSDTVLASRETQDELQEVVQGPKFNKTRLLELRIGFLAGYLYRFETVRVFDRVADCRDPKGNKFLELALAGKADLLITGDAALLSLRSWRGVAILSPADFLALSE